MASQRTRWMELAGAFVLGGGLVALGYELKLRPQDIPIPGGDAAPQTAAAAQLEGSGTTGTPSQGSTGSDLDADTDSDRRAAVAAQDLLPAYEQPDADGSYTAFPPLASPAVPLLAEDELAYPRHGLITSPAAIIRTRADLDSPILGILREGARIRVDRERSFGGGCKSGWHRMFPTGWVCVAAGLEVGDDPPQRTSEPVDPVLDGPLPYEYWRVNSDATPFFHRLPSFGEQDRADAAGQAWVAEHGRTPMPTAPTERPEDVPAVVKEYMNAGYYVTKAGEEVRSERRFIRTTRGAYARKYQLGQKSSPSFRGKLVTANAGLPIFFIRRELALMAREAPDSDILQRTETVPERLGTWPFVRRIHLGSYDYFEDADGLLMRAYAVGEAYKLKRPPGVGPEEHWVHVDLSEQTLVAYEGDVPVFATLVSTGKEAGMTPVGVHRVQIKHVATSMRDQPVEDEAYSIDDVPWTQYFSGSIALHGAFWHAGFGTERSHGCVNLSPSDARWLFGFTEPTLLDGWHAVAPTGSSKGSAVVVTP